jgi:hypothetical protein
LKLKKSKMAKGAPTRRPPGLVTPKPVKVTSKALVYAAGMAVVLTLIAGYFVSSSVPPRKAGVEIVHFDNRRVYILDDFFDPVTLDSWRQKLRGEWDAGAWVFATNNNGSGAAGGNQKVVSRERIEERNQVALKLFQDGQFSYAKWELRRDNPVHQVGVSIAVFYNYLPPFFLEFRNRNY